MLFPDPLLFKIYMYYNECNYSKNYPNNPFWGQNIVCEDLRLKIFKNPVTFL